jgi:hypothetical protein
MTTDVSKLVYYGSFHSIVSYGVWFNRRKEAIHHTTQKKVIRIMANAQERELSGSLHHQLASEYIQSLLSLRRICRDL